MRTLNHTIAIFGFAFAVMFGYAAAAENQRKHLGVTAADRSEIIDLVLFSGQTIDDRDAEAFAQLWTETDSVFYYPGKTYKGRAAVKTWAIEHIKSGIANGKRHLYSNIRAYRDPKDGKYYATAYMTIMNVAGDVAPLAIAFLKQEVRKTDAGWKVVSRKLNFRLK